MKKIAKRFNVSKTLIITLAALIAFSMAACKDNDDKDGGNSSGNGNGGDSVFLEINWIFPVRCIWKN